MGSTTKYGFIDISSDTGWIDDIEDNIAIVEEMMHSRRYGQIGEDIDAYSAVAMYSDGLWYKHRLINGRQSIQGILIEDGSGGDWCRIVCEGSISNSSWSWIPGLMVYASTITSGALTQTRPRRNIQALGVATSSTEIFLEGNTGILLSGTTTTTTSTTTSSSTTSSTTSTSSSTTSSTTSTSSSTTSSTTSTSSSTTSSTTSTSSSTTSSTTSTSSSTTSSTTSTSSSTTSSTTSTSSSTTSSTTSTSSSTTSSTTSTSSSTTTTTPP